MHPRREFLGTMATFGAAAPLMMAAPALAKTGQVDPVGVINRFHENYNNNELDKDRPMVVDDVVADINGGEGAPNGVTFRGREAFIAWLKSDKVTFPNNKLVHQDLISHGNMGALRFYMEGVHQGPLRTAAGIIQPTGRKVRLEVTEFATFTPDGRLIHVHTLYNTQGLIMQLTGKA